MGFGILVCFFIFDILTNNFHMNIQITDTNTPSEVIRLGHPYQILGP